MKFQYQQRKVFWISPTCLLAFFLFSFQPTFASELKYISITLGQYKISHNFLLADKNNVIYVPAKYLARAMGADYTFSEADKACLIKLNHLNVIIDTSFRIHSEYELFYNDFLVALQHPIRIEKDDVILLPLKSLATALRMPLEIKKISETWKQSVTESEQEAIRYLTINNKNLKRFGFYAGLSSFTPGVTGLHLDRTWATFGAAWLRINDNCLVEFCYDTFTSTQEAMFLGEWSHIKFETQGLTGYFVYFFPQNMTNEKCNLSVGLGLGAHRFDIYKDSSSMYYHHWDSISTYELKLSTEFFYAENWSIALEIRGVKGRKRLALSQFGESFIIDLDGVFIAIGQRYCF